MRVTVAEHGRVAYMANGWDKMRRWSGDYARRPDWTGTDEYEQVPLAGIEGPSVEAGSWTPTPSEGTATGTGWEPGSHTFRYRYKDSRTGYVSNPSVEASYTVSAASKKLTFSVASPGSAGAGDIVRSTDKKVDQIVLEATVVNGGDFFVASTFDMFNSSGGYVSSLVVEITDEELAGETLAWDDADDAAPGFGHTPPPVKRYVLSHRGRLWCYGEAIYDNGTVTVTNGSTTVTGSGTNFTEAALGASGEPPVTGLRLLNAGSDDYYEIDYYSSATTAVLKRQYQGTTQSGVSYQIVSGNNDIHVSRADYPESFPPDSTIALPTSGVGGQVTAARGVDAAVIFFTERSSYRFMYDLEPSQDGAWYPIPGDRGAIHQRLTLAHEGRVYAMDRQGVWVYSGGVPREISRPIESTINALSWEYAEQFFMVYLPRIKAIRIYVILTGYNSYYLQYDPARDVWQAGSTEQQMNAGATCWLSTESAFRPVLGDTAGHCWFADYGTCDGVTSANSHKTVTTGSTSSQIAISGGLSASDDYRGVWAYWVEGGETKLVSTHSTTALILSSAYSQAPSSGDTIWLGRIPAKLKTKAFYASKVGMQGSQYVKYLRFGYRKLSSSRKVAVRVYKDLSSTAMTWDVSSLAASRDNVALPGSVDGYASSDWVVDLSLGDGYAEIPLGIGEFRVLEVEFEVLESDTELELWGVEVEGVESRGDV